MDRRLWMLAVLLLLSLTARGAAAQEASPAADDFVTPDPSECQVAPRTVDQLLGFLATPTAGTPVPDGSAAPRGEPADADTSAAVTAVTHELYSCLNANAFLRVFALYSDGYVARSLVAESVAPEALGLFATPIPPQQVSERTSFAVREVQALPDGRVSVLVAERNPYAGNAESTTIFVFAQLDDRWLVDDIITNPAGSD